MRTNRTDSARLRPCAWPRRLLPPALYGGFCSTFSRSADRFNPEELSDGLGERFETMRIVDKFRKLTRRKMPADRQDALIEAVLGMEQLNDAGTIVRLMVVPPKQVG